MATLFATVVVVFRLAFGVAPFERIGVGWVTIVAAYYVAFAVGGSVQGVLDPFKTTLLGALASGVVLVLPLYLSAAVLLGLAGKLFRSMGTNLAVGLMLSLVTGVLVGFGILMTGDDETGRSATDPGEPSEPPGGGPSDS